MFLNEKGTGRRPGPILAMTTLLIILLSAATIPERLTPTPTGAIPADALMARVRHTLPRQFSDSTGPSEQRDSIVAEQARRWRMPVELALAISHTENWGGDSAAISRAGAVGLMQVMPEIWGDQFLFECGFENLTNRRRNACVGVLVALNYFEHRGNWDAALRDYNGARCKARHSPEYCIRMARRGDDYVLTVVRKIYRTDLSASRDAAFRTTREGKNLLASTSQ